jgi:hypothetical protein
MLKTKLLTYPERSSRSLHRYDVMQETRMSRRGLVLAIRGCSSSTMLRFKRIMLVTSNIFRGELLRVKVVHEGADFFLLVVAFKGPVHGVSVIHDHVLTEGKKVMASVAFEVPPAYLVACNIISS